MDKKRLDAIIWNEWSKNKTPDIRQVGPDFVMDTMPFKARFKHSSQDEKPFIYEAEGKSISFKPAGMWWTTPQGNVTVHTAIPIVGQLVKGKVKYIDALGSGVDIECSTERTRWKKQVIIKSLANLGIIPGGAKFLEIGFEFETDFDIEGWDGKSDYHFNKAIKLGELSQIESVKALDSHIPVEPKEGEEPEDLLERCDGFLRVKGGKSYLIKQIPVSYLKQAVYPVRTDVEIAYGSEYVFNEANTYYISCAALDSTHFVVGFKDNVPPYYGIARIGEVTGNAIAYGSEYAFHEANTYCISCAALDATHFVVGFRDYGGDDYGIARIGEVTGNAIAYGSEYVFNEAGTDYISCAALDASHFVVGFRDYGGDNYGIARIGSLSTPYILENKSANMAAKMVAAGLI